MLKDKYLQDIINHLGIAISPENNAEIIIKSRISYDKKNNIFILSDEYDTFSQDYGTIITDFQNTDFTNKEDFIDFFHKYCLFGLEDKKINLLFSSGECSATEYNSFIEKIIKKYTKILISYQKDINSILDYCMFSPNKKTKSLTPFERLCILEYLPNTPSLLQDNSITVIHLSTLSNIDNPNCTEIELVTKLKEPSCKAYSNSLYVPNTVASLLNFELTEILKDNIMLKICNYCNKYFIASNRNTAYCNNIAPGYTSKTCKQIARNKMYLENKNKDEALALFTKVYNNKAYKASRYKDINNYYIDYKHFQEVGKKKITAYKNKKITKEDFIDWINRNK